MIMSKISLKYIHNYIHNFKHSRVFMNINLSTHGFLFHSNINRKENKVQTPLIIHHNKKKQECISDVQQKIIELHKLVN